MYPLLLELRLLETCILHLQHSLHHNMLDVLNVRVPVVLLVVLRRGQGSRSLLRDQENNTRLAAFSAAGTSCCSGIFK